MTCTEERESNDETFHITMLLVNLLFIKRCLFQFTITFLPLMIYIPLSCDESVTLRPLKS